ncbi:MAG TPA: ferrous iron transport protein A [Blastocatellia bacterium]|nr:ferrous iron transport protein A [Blastocatellia bacterium]
MSLLEAARNKTYFIDRLEGPEAECRRLLDLGLTPGEEMCLVQAVPFGDPLVVEVRGMRLALRRREAAWIRLR